MLHVSHIISGDLWAGAEVMAYHLLKGLTAYNDLKITVILLNEGKLAEKLKDEGVITHILDESKNSFPRICCSIRKILSNNQPDIIHSHRYKENFLAFLISIILQKSKLISTQHGMPEVIGKVPGIRHNIISRCNFFFAFTLF